MGNSSAVSSDKAVETLARRSSLQGPCSSLLRWPWDHQQQYHRIFRGTLSGAPSLYAYIYIYIYMYIYPYLAVFI